MARPWAELGRDLWARSARAQAWRRAPGRGEAEEPAPRRLSVAPTPAPAEPAPVGAPPTGPVPVPAESAAPRPLDGRIQAMLEQVLQTRLPVIRVHTDLAADVLARHHKADALVSGGEIHFRRGAFAPDTSRGRGLLAHEALHLAWARGLRPVTAPTTAFDPAAWEEEVALEVERRVLRNPALTAPAFSRSGPTSRMPAATEGTPAPRGAVRTASADRDVSTPSTASSGGGGLGEGQLRALKEELYRMLLDRLRSEFERGG